MTASIRPVRCLVAALLAAVLVAASCGDDTDTTEDDGAARPFTVMLNWTPNAHHAGIYLAAADGRYADAGLDVEIIEPALDIGVETAVASGRADVGLAQAESLLPARAAGVDVVAVATVLPTNDSVLMSLADDGIDEPADLAGATYGGFGGALETELISTLVSCDGADPDRVDQVEVGNVDYLAGLRQDRFDVVWVFGGWDLLRAEAVEGVEVDAIRFDEHLDCIPDWYTPLVLADASAITDDAAALEGFLAATAEGYADAAEDPARAAQALLDAAPELDSDLVEAATAYYAPRFAPDGRWGEMDAATWDRFADFLVTAGLLDQPVDADAAWTGSLLPDRG